MTISDTWKDQFKQAANNIPPTIRLTPLSKEKSIVSITIMWSLKKKKDFNSPQNVKRLIQRSGKPLLKQAIEKELSLQKVKGKTSTGYFFTLTDKVPKPGEYKYLRQGGIGVGDILLIFTILYNEEKSEFPNISLKIISTAEQQK